MSAVLTPESTMREVIDGGSRRAASCAAAAKSKPTGASAMKSALDDHAHDGVPRDAMRPVNSDASASVRAGMRPIGMSAMPSPSKSTSASSETVFR